MTKNVLINLILNQTETMLLVHEVNILTHNQYRQQIAKNSDNKQLKDKNQQEFAMNVDSCFLGDKLKSLTKTNTNQKEAKFQVLIFSYQKT